MGATITCDSGLICLTSSITSSSLSISVRTGSSGMLFEPICSRMTSSVGRVNCPILPFMWSVLAPGFVKQQESMSLELTIWPRPLTIELPTMVKRVFCLSVVGSIGGVRARSCSPLEWSASSSSQSSVRAAYLLWQGTVQTCSVFTDFLSSREIRFAFLAWNLEFSTQNYSNFVTRSCSSFWESLIKHVSTFTNAISLSRWSYCSRLIWWLCPSIGLLWNRNWPRPIRSSCIGVLLHNISLRDVSLSDGLDRPASNGAWFAEDVWPHCRPSLWWRDMSVFVGLLLPSVGGDKIW